jgi:ribokinase
MASPGPIVVIGSINMDLVCRTPRLPAAGETVIGDELLTIPGGKGANQAVAAARLGGEVRMVGRVGDDDFGRRLLSGLERDGVHTETVTVTRGVPTGCAMILVDAAGENSIVVSPGANARVSPADVDRAGPLIARASAVVLQLEIPPATVRHALALCRRHGVFAILDPAPVPPKGLSRAILAGVDLLTPNETEAQTLARASASKKAGAELLARGARAVVLKLGRRGAMIVGRDGEPQAVRPFRVKAVDTTAAGDAFTGALAVAISEGMPLAQAVRFANAAGALCCQGFGAQPSLPTRVAVDALLARAR